MQKLDFLIPSCNLLLVVMSLLLVAMHLLLLAVIPGQLVWVKRAFPTDPGPGLAGAGLLASQDGIQVSTNCKTRSY